MASPSDFWNEQRVEQLKTFNAEGVSASIIGGKLGTTRCAVLGKLNRLGLSNPRQKAPPKQPVQRKPIIRIIRMNGNSDKMRVMQSVTGAPFICVPVNVVPLNKTLLELEPGECRQPYGDGEYVFCAHPVREGSSYCEVHHRKNWVAPIPPKPRYVREAA